MQALNLTRFTHRASYISDRLNQAEEEIKATRDALAAADLDPDQFERARRLLSNISLLLDRAHDEADEDQPPAIKPNLIEIQTGLRMVHAKKGLNYATYT